jgi:hypothetical protein
MQPAHSTEPHEKVPLFIAELFTSHQSNQLHPYHPYPPWLRMASKAKRASDAYRLAGTITVRASVTASTALRVYFTGKYLSSFHSSNRSR